MATLARYNTFKRLKKSDVPKKAVRLNSVEQKTELENFLKLLGKKKAKQKIISLSGEKYNRLYS
jgi:hypothetical protein